MIDSRQKNILTTQQWCGYRNDNDSMSAGGLANQSIIAWIAMNFEHTFPWPTEDAHRDFVDPGACHEPPSDHNYYLSSEMSEHLQNGLAPSCALSFMVPR